MVLIVGALLVGTAIARTAPGLRWPGIGYAVSLTIFSFGGVLGFGAGTQPVAGLLLVASTVLLARRLPRVGTRAADGEATDSGVLAPPVVVSVERA